MTTNQHTCLPLYGSINPEWHECGCSNIIGTVAKKEGICCQNCGCIVLEWSNKDNE